MMWQIDQGTFFGGSLDKSWKFFLFIAISLFMILFALGCDDKNSASTTPMTTEQLLQRYSKTPVGESIAPIAKSLGTEKVMVGIESSLSENPGKMQLKVNADRFGRIWAYAYTSESEFLKVLPAGTRFARLGFADLFKIVQQDQRFAGIVLNSGSDTAYFIPRELFADVQKQLQ